MLLDAATQKITAILSGPPATTNPTFMSNYGTSAGHIPKNGTLSASAADVVPLLGSSGGQNEVFLISIYNPDTAAVTVTVNLVDSVAGATRPIFVATLAVGDTLQYTPTPGWRCLDSSGRVKQVATAGPVASTSANAFAVGPNGTNNPSLNVDASTSSAAGGLNVTGKADAAGVALAAIGSNTNEPMTIDGKGSGVVTIGSVSTGGTVVRSKVATVAVGGTAIGNANAVGEGFTAVTGADDTAAVILPATVAGKMVKIKNTVANKILIVFPPVSSKVNGGATNAAYNMAAGSTREFIATNTTQWWTAPETIA